MTLLILTVWRKHWVLPLVFFSVFATIECAFLSSSLLKVNQGSLLIMRLVLLFCFSALIHQSLHTKCKLHGRAGAANQATSHCDRTVMDFSCVHRCVTGAKGWLVQSHGGASLMLRMRSPRVQCSCC